MTQAFIDGFRERLIPVFDNMEEDAQRAADAYWNERMAQPAYNDGPDEGDIAEWAEGRGVEAYMDLAFVRDQLIGLGIAGLYHLWERLLKEFFVHEHSIVHSGVAPQRIRRWDFPTLQQHLNDCGYDIEAKVFFHHLNRTRLIANTVKHGDGSSCRDLIAEAPELFREPIMGSPRFADLELVPIHFDESADAIKAYWEDTPEWLHYPS